MGRPLKQGLDFFSISTSFFQNRKIQRLIRAKGLNAGMTYIATLCKIYSGNGYYAEIDENLFLDVGVMTGIEEGKVAEIIRFCIELELFDQKLAFNKNVLTSFGIQRQNWYAHKRNNRCIDPALAVDEWMTTGMPLFEGEVSEEKLPVLDPKPGVSAEKPPISEEKLPVSAEKPPVLDAKSAHTDNIERTNNLKLKIYEKKNKTNRKNTEQPATRKFYTQPGRSADDARWAELQRLAAEATGSDRND